jgi:hypothetical protein
MPGTSPPNVKVRQQTEKNLNFKPTHIRNMAGAAAGALCQYIVIAKTN